MINSKVAIITGAAKGIGRETAIRFAQEGYKLTLVDIEEQSLEELNSFITKEYGVETIFCVGDLALESFLNLIIFYTISKWSRVDVLVNNAAWRTIETMRSISMQTWNQTMQICLTAPAF
jgi:short-subunit dehydrogenase